MTGRHGIGRALLFVFWSLVAWGTLYGLALLRVAVVEGPAAALRQGLASRDALGGFTNLALAILALAVWSLVGVVLWGARRRRRFTSQGSEGEPRG